MDKYYAGIGSRQTPQNILEFMVACAEVLSVRGFTLRSGGAAGADTAFALGASVMEIYRPRNENTTNFKWTTRYSDILWDKAMGLAEHLHPAWDRCSPWARALHARNCFQVLGHDLMTPSKFVICWTQDGAINTNECGYGTGGTGMAIRVASMHDIPVYNLRRPGHREFIAQEILGSPHPADAGG